MQNLLHDDKTDADLVLRAQNGDHEALDSLIRNHQPWILHMAQRMLWNRAEAEDTALEIVKAIAHLTVETEEIEVMGARVVDRGKLRVELTPKGPGGACYCGTPISGDLEE